MAKVSSDDQLREMARNRGLKLIKSRKRKPGIGDYGKYGLADAAGNALFGGDQHGLTASAAEIEAYLRTDALGTWKKSTKIAGPLPTKKTRKTTPDSDDVAGRSDRKRPAEKLGKLSAKKGGEETGLRHALKVAADPDTELEPNPVLRIREARGADAEAVAALLNQLGGVSIDPKGVSDNLTKMRGTRCGFLVADQGGIIGCCGWTAVPTIHRGLIGRLSLLVVEKGHRRRGVGRAMLNSIEGAMQKTGCRQLETISDISIVNSHNFFRSLGFEQTSYRFVREISERGDVTCPGD